MNRADDSIVIKYFDLIDEFVRVRCCSDDVLAEIAGGRVSDKASYRSAVIGACLPDYSTEIRSALERLGDDYENEVVDELIYQLAIDVNPSLEIHQVSLPSTAAGPGADTENEASAGPQSAMARDQRFQLVNGLDKALRRQVIGQDEAIDVLVRSVKKAAVGLKRPGTPIGTFLLIGRTGTGKTELAKALARTLFADSGRLVRVDCSEYALPHEYAKLIGSPPGYIGHNEGGYLTESVRKQPRCVVLFDEIEKAHEKVHNLLLQLLDEGVLTDSRGQRVSFEETIVILTSNLGIEKLDALRSRMGFQQPDAAAATDDGDLREVTIDALKEFFRPEFVNRIDEIAVFNALDVQVCVRIAQRMLGEIGELLARRGIHVDCSPGVRNLLAREGFSEEYGARELQRLIKRRVEDPLTDLILGENLGPGARVRVRIRAGQPVLQVERRRAPQRQADRAQA